MLCQADHDDFKTKLMVAFDKAMLRNPEIAIDAFVAMIAGVSIDLSAYSSALIKHLGSE